METQSEKTTDNQCTVKDIKFKTGPNGKLNVVLMLTPSKTLRKLGVNSIVLSSLDSIVNQGLGIGSRLMCTFVKKTGEVKEVNILTKSGKRPGYPTYCPDCNTVLKLVEGNELICPSLTCPSRPTAFIYKVIELATGIDSAINEQFVTKYVTSEGTVDIQHFDEFFLMLKSIKNKNTNSRLDLWQKHHGEEIGQMFFDVDVAVSNYLSNKMFLRAHFWRICNFPRITSQQLHELSGLNPSCIGKGKFSSISKQGRNYVLYNAPFIEFLVRKLTECGVREWV